MIKLNQILKISIYKQQCQLIINNNSKFKKLKK